MFDFKTGNMEIEKLNWTVNDYELNRDQCKEYLHNLPDWSHIPTINNIPLDSMADGCLARYQGMIQDIMNPEYYYSKYKVKNKATGEVISRSGEMRDLLYCQESEELAMDEDHGLKDNEARYPIFCIPIPGLNAWTKNVSQNDQSTHFSESRVSGQKRPLEEDTEMEVEEDKKPRTTDSLQSKAAALECVHDKYFPLTETGGLACIVKHYGEYEDFLLNTRIEAVGFLSLNPALEASWQDSDAEDKAMHPPPSIVPRLHAVLVRKLAHCNPELPLNAEVSDMAFSSIRNDLHTALSQIFFGDTLAADYVICNLLASVYVRKEGLTLGALSVNIYNICNLTSGPTFPILVSEFLESILPSSVLLPLTIDLLNSSPFVPKKDYEANKLMSGRLQLPDETHLIVDETKMTAGTLKGPGVHNMAALHALTLRQELSYDFNYFQMPFPTNIPVLVLSEGKSMIPTDAPVKLQPETGAAANIAETFAAARFFMSGSRLAAVRKYISVVRLKQCDMNNTEFVGPAWANLRQQHVHLRQDDLHRLLVISRLIALSQGHNALVKDDWDKAVAMEMDRQFRARS